MAPPNDIWRQELSSEALEDQRDSRVIIDHPLRSLPASGLVTFRETVFREIEPNQLSPAEVKDLEGKIGEPLIIAFYEQWKKKCKKDTWDPSQ